MKIENMWVLYKHVSFFWLIKLLGWSFYRSSHLWSFFRKKSSSI